ncbi:P-loop NTPase fold protein [Stappia sp. TSB10GB4]|uniref:KAP family P-loop NTPase fold protein n=1 Tax=Stappia sp. TSB10GB4 TaxID=2003584 RepID=UPI0016492F8F|nr:P-loop NTPase fold protein [Stappia sp. TSB10GB4]
MLGDDLPKQNPWVQDRLNYAPFASRITKVITSLTAPNGYVIGIHGQWGTGKSTAINFILAYLNKHNAEHEDDQVIHIDFRPWIVSGHQDLITVFFKILSERLGPRDSKWVRFWRRTLRFMHGTTDNLVDAAATVALTVDPTGTASGFGSNVAKKSVNALLGRFLEDPSLQTAYESLKDQLSRSGKRFLVTIDDIDRLDDDNVRAIMQMVKSIGRLPNVVYLLSYDRDIVWDALDRKVNRIGPRFAEKIVQQEIELPIPSRNALLAILNEEISFLTVDTPATTRWHYLVRDGINRWIRSPRDIVRLSNAAKFSWPAMEGEIDPQDLLAMEGIRLFDQAAFSWIRDNRDFIFTEGRFFMSNDDVKIEAAEDLKARIPDGCRSQVMRILTILFPQAGKWFEGKGHYSDESFIETTRRRGVGSAAGYDTYFGLHPSSDAIPKAVVNELMSKLDSADDCERIIRAYLGRTNSRGELMVAKLLDELRVQFRHPHAAMPQQGLLDALFRVGEEIISIDRDAGMFELSPRSQLMFLVRNMLEQWGVEAAGEHLVEAFGKADSAMFLAEQFTDRGRELQIFKSSSTEPPTIDAEAFAKLGKTLVGKIKQGEVERTLEKSAYYFNIVRAWAYLLGADQPKQWLARGMLESADFMAKAARGLVSYSLGTPVRRYTMRDNPDRNLFDLDVLLEAGRKHLAETDLTDDQRSIITAILRGAEHLKQGRSPTVDDLERND